MLDPEDWSLLHTPAHKMPDDALDKMESALEGRVWNPFPEEMKTALQTDLPRSGIGLESVRQKLTDLLPYGVGNTHPRFFGWVHGAENPGGILAEITKNENLWLHVDDAFGATAALSKKVKSRLPGLEHADSLAFDFHKWLHVNSDAGCVLVRSGDAHLKSFSGRPEYLTGSVRGLAAGSPWPVDFGPELSRGFRTLKVWAYFLEHGVDKLTNPSKREGKPG